MFGAVKIKKIISYLSGLLLTIRGNRFLLLFCFLIFFCFTGVLIYICNPIWDVADDIGQSMWAHGYGLYVYGLPNLPFSNVLWGYFVRSVPSIYGVPGYSTATLGVLLVLGGIVQFLITKSTNSIILGGLIAILIFSQPIIRPQYTINAGLLAATGLLLCFNYLQTKRKAWALSGLVLLFIGFLVRKEEALLIAGISLPLIPWRKVAVDRFFYLLVFSFLFAVSLATVYDNEINRIYKNPYEDSNNDMKILVDILDYGKGKILYDNLEDLKKYNLSKNDVDLISSWFLLDRKLIDPDRLDRIFTKLKPDYSFKALSIGSLNGINALFRIETIILFITSFLIFFASFSKELLSAWILFFVLLIYFGIVGRPFPYRVIYPLVALMICFPIVYYYPTIELISRYKNLILSIFFFITILNLSINIYHGNRREWKSAAVVKAMQFFPKEPVLFWSSGLVVLYGYPVFIRNENLHVAKMYSAQGLGGVHTLATSEFSKGRDMLKLFFRKGIPIIAPATNYHMLEKYCIERNGIYRDALIKSIMDHEIRYCYCINNRL
jgi:hypothetical protein